MNSNKSEEIVKEGGQMNAFDDGTTNVSGRDGGTGVRDNVSEEKKAESGVNNTKGNRGRTGTRQKPKAPAKTNNSTDNKKAFDLSPYVSNPEGNIYAIHNVPEEFIATLFAWVSRSSKSFKTHLQDVIQDFDLQATQASQADQSMAEKAGKFHEKWTVGYGHSCYDAETDVLTKRGFVNWKDVSEDDEFASINPATNEIEYQKAIRLINEPYSGPMYKVDRNRVDMLVTPNHKIFAWPRHKIEDFETRKYQLIEAEKLKDKCYKVKLGGFIHHGDIVDTIQGYPAESLLSLYGFFIGDGYIDPRMPKAIQFRLRKQRKINYLYELCSELGLNISANANDKFYITSPKDDIGLIMGECYNKQREKQIPRSLFELSSELLHYLYEGLLNSDGHIGRTGEVYDTSSLTLVSQIQELCALIGWTSSVTLIHPEGSKGNNKDVWRIFVNKKLLESMINKVQYDVFDEYVEYEGRVYCAELPKYHTLIVRRNGRIHVSGNSVAEHAKSAVGIESVSRLASAELELANQFLSITEYSQRYQKPQRGNWVNPFKAGTDEHREIDALFGSLFTKFEQLIDVVYTDLKRAYTESDAYQELLLAKVALDPEKNPAHKAKLEGIEKQITRELAALEKLAFEDARYVLPLAMHTQLGVSANARSWADVIRKMDASYIPESREIAESLRTEITKVLPTLLRHSSASSYQKLYQESRKAVFGDISKIKNRAHIGASPYRLPSMSEDAIILEVLSMELMAVTGMIREQAREMIKRNTASQNKSKVATLLEGMASFDTPPESFKHVNIEISLEVSEANWHQLLRHNRMTDFTYGIATPHLGYETPPRIAAAGEQAMKIFREAMTDSLKAYNLIKDKSGVDEAQYAVLNAHYRPITMTFSLWEAYHLISLRTSEEAQWDIKDTFDEVYNRLLTHYPTLLSQAKRR